MNYETTMTGTLDGGVLAERENTSRRRVIIALIVVAILVAIGAAYYFMGGSGAAAPAGDEKNSQAQTVTVVAPGRAEKFPLALSAKVVR